MSVILFDSDIQGDHRRSSKGNQLKWMKGQTWYKADYCGYEGLAEYMISRMIEKSTLHEIENIDFVKYSTVEISYKSTTYRGCQSENFLKPGEQLVTLERLFHNYYGTGMTAAVYHIEDHAERLKFIVNQMERLTGLRNFGRYMYCLMVIDALFLNEDRHLHNIAVITDGNGKFRFSPIFDQGAGMLSDTTMDYPLSMDIYEAIDSVKAKTFCEDLREQLEITENVYGEGLRFHMGVQEMRKLLDEEQYYPDDIRQRVLQILLEQKRKYAYLFTN